MEALGSQTYRGRSRRRLPLEEGAFADGAPTPPGRDDAQGLYGKFLDGLDRLSTDEILRRVKGTVGNTYYIVLILMHPNQDYVSLVSLRFSFYFNPFFFISSFSSLLQGLQGYRTTRPPIPEDAAGRTACRLAAKEKKKDVEKKRAREKRAALNALEKHRRAQVREGVPLEPSPNTQDDDDSDDEGMEVWLGFNPEVVLWFEPSLVGPSDSVDAPA